MRAGRVEEDGYGRLKAQQKNTMKAGGRWGARGAERVCVRNCLLVAFHGAGGSGPRVIAASAG